MRRLSSTRPHTHTLKLTLLTPPPSPAVWSPDVTIPFTDQGRHPVRDSTLLEQKGQAWLDSHKKHVAKDVSKIGLLDSYARKY